jgi:hypothetical protein
VKSVKTHLRRVVGGQILTFEELIIVLVQIEAVLNSRPLCPLSSDPNDLTALTPGHILTLAPLTCLPEPNLGHVKLNRLSLATSPENAPVLSGLLALAPRIPAHLTTAVQVA